MVVLSFETTKRRWILGGLSVLVTMLLASGSCDLDTRTTACESGFRCPPGWQCAAFQDVCISNGCGDGILDWTAGEICDDGNIIDGDGCSADCRSIEDCGDGVLNEGEVCDDGNNIGGDGCSADCLLESCGNGRLDEGEVCDQGELNSDEPNAECRTTCQLPECGDSIVDDLRGEQCDNGANNSNAPNAPCRLDCRNRRCGDGIVDDQFGEQCDDGNNLSGDGCSADCQIE